MSETKLEYSSDTFLSGANPVRKLLLVTVGLILVVACTPTVKVATDEPITINLNVNIKHEILIKVDKDLEGVFSKESGLF